MYSFLCYSFPQRCLDGSATNPYCSLIFFLKVLTSWSAWCMWRSSHHMSRFSACRHYFSCHLRVTLLDLLLCLNLIEIWVEWELTESSYISHSLLCACPCPCPCACGSSLTPPPNSFSRSFFNASSLIFWLLWHFAFEVSLSMVL